MKKLEKVFDAIGEILAVVMVLVYLLLLIDAVVPFLESAPIVVNILNILKLYGSIALIGVVGMEAVSKRNIVIRIIFYIIFAAVVIFLFFPGTYQNLVGLLPL